MKSKTEEKYILSKKKKNYWQNSSPNGYALIKT